MIIQLAGILKIDGVGGRKMSDEVVERLESLSLDFFVGTTSQVIKNIVAVTKQLEKTHRNITMEPEDRYIIISGTRDMSKNEIKEKREKTKKEIMKRTQDEALDSLFEQTMSKLEKQDD